MLRPAKSSIWQRPGRGFARLSLKLSSTVSETVQTLPHGEGAFCNVAPVPSPIIVDRLRLIESLPEVQPLVWNHCYDLPPQRPQKQPDAAEEEHEDDEQVESA